MSNVVEMGWDEEPDATRVRAMRLEGAAWVERRYSELRTGDIFYALSAEGVRVDVTTQLPLVGEQYCLVEKDPICHLRGKGYWLPVQVADSPAGLLAPANSSRPGEVL